VTTYSLFGQAPQTGEGPESGTNGTLGLHFTTSAAGTLEGIWFYSPAGQSQTQLPTSIGLYNYSSHTLLTSNTASWSGAAGSGWVYAALTTAQALTSGTGYMAVVFRNDATNVWFSYNDEFTWPVTSGILTAPEDTGAGQGWFHSGTTLTFPATQNPGFNFYIDVSVVTATAHAGTAADTVTPAGSAAALRGGAAHTGEASLEVTPSTSATASHGATAHTAAAGLTVTPAGAAAVPGGPSFLLAEDGSGLADEAGNPLEAENTAPLAHTATAALTVTPSAVAAPVSNDSILAEDGSPLLDEAGSPLQVENTLPAAHAAPAGLTVTPGLHATPAGGTPQVTVAGTWPASWASQSGFVFPFPSARPMQVTVENTAGDWLFAIMTWRQAAAGSGVYGGPSMTVADDAHNFWEPVGAPLADSFAAGVVRTSVWAAPAARVANPESGQTIIQVAPTGPVLAMAALIVDVAGLEPWMTATAIGTAYVNNAAALSLSMPEAPAARALLFAAVGSDNNSHTVSGPSGWTSLPGVTAGNGVDTTADITLDSHYMLAAAAESAAVTATGTLDFGAVIAGVLVSAPAPAQPSPDWPVMITEAALGSGLQTPPAALTWTDISGRALAMSISQGRQYTLAQLTAGQGTMTLDDPDGDLIPPGYGALAGLDSGTPVRRRVIIPQLPSPHYVPFNGFFRRWPWKMDADLYRGQVTAEIADAWAYAAGTLNSMAVEECLIDQPYALWPMTDSSGGMGASNVAPGNSSALLLTTSKYGAGGAGQTWGQNTSVLLGASSSETTASGNGGGATGMWEQTVAGAALAANGYGFALACTDSAFPSVTGGVTVEVFAQPEITSTLTAISGNGLFQVTGKGLKFNTASSSFPSGMPVVLGVEPGNFVFPNPFTPGQVYYVRDTDTSGNYNLSATPGGPVFPVTSTGTCVGTITPQLPYNPVILSARNGKGPVFEVAIRATDGALLLTYLSSGGAVDTIAVDVHHDYRDLGLFHVSIAVTPLTYRILVDGGGVASLAGSFGQVPSVFRELTFGGIQDSTASGYAMPGYLGFAAVYPGISSQQRVISRYVATRIGAGNEAACDRIERILEYAGLNGRRWLGQQQVAYEGDLVPSGQDIGGQAAASSAGNIAQSTLPAMLYVAPTGDITYLSKLYTWNQPVRWTLGDQVAAGEIPFKVGIATDYDPSRVVEQVQLTQLDTQAVTVPSGSSSAANMAAVAAATALQYGGQPYQQTGYLAADWSSPYNAGGSLVDLANWLATVYARPANRIQSVTVEAAANSANASSRQAWAFFAGASNGDMVQVNVRVPTAARSPLITLTARITQTQRTSKYSQDGASASISCVLDFAPEYQALTCDDPVRGLLNGVNRLAW
jgi:hypothetical protein